MLSIDFHNKHFEKFWNFALNKVTSKYASKCTCSKSCFSLHTYPYCSRPTSSINPTTMIKSKLPNEPHGLKSNGLQCRVGTWGSKPKLGLILGEVVDHRDGQEEDNQRKTLGDHNMSWSHGHSHLLFLFRNCESYKESS